MKHIKYIAYISLFLLASCSTTKNLPEGEVLYTGIKKIEVTNEDKSKEGERGADGNRGRSCLSAQ